VPYHVLTEARILEDTLPSGSDLSGERLPIMHPVDDETDFLAVLHPTGRFLLVPQGTRLIGNYDSQVAFGQSRVPLVWTRLIMPNGRPSLAPIPPAMQDWRMVLTIIAALCSRLLSCPRCFELDASWDRVQMAVITVTSSRRCAAALARVQIRPDRKSFIEIQTSSRH
jgi:hypothetical protein